MSTKYYDTIEVYEKGHIKYIWAGKWLQFYGEIKIVV